MKNYLKITFLALAMILVCGGVSAQNNKQRMTREQFSETQAKHISDALALDDKTSDRFVKTYMQQQREIWALGPRLKRGSGNSEAESEKAIQQRFERSQKLLNIREKYYKEYSKFLTQKQIQRMYEIERQTMKRLQSRAAHRQRGNR
jgi:hypothetical protein